MVKDNRNISIDSLKGLLIFLVVLGHSLLGTLDENPLRYLIYSFHMPAFFFISGYLLDIDKLKLSSYKNIFTKYWHRMLKMWLVAWVIYTVYVIRTDFSFVSICHQIYNPYYHLWFVPALFLSIIFLAFVFRNIKSETIAICVHVICGLFSYNLSVSDYMIPGLWIISTSFFLFLGILSRRKLRIYVSAWGWIIMAFVLVVMAADLIMRMSIDTYREHFQLPLCTGLLLFGFLPIIQHKLWFSGIFQLWGKYSLEIYLWHVIPLLLLKHFLVNNTLIYYIVVFAILLMSFALSFNNTKNKKYETCHCFYTGKRW